MTYNSRNMFLVRVKCRTSIQQSRQCSRVMWCFHLVVCSPQSLCVDHQIPVALWMVPPVQPRGEAIKGAGTICSRLLQRGEPPL